MTKLDEALLELEPLPMTQLELVELANVGGLVVHIWTDDDILKIEPSGADPLLVDLLANRVEAGKVEVSPLTESGFECLAIWAAAQLGELD